MRLMICILIVFMSSCANNDDKNKILIKSFVDSVVLGSGDYSSFISVDTQDNSKGDLDQFIKLNIEILKKSIEERDTNFQILTDRETKNINIDANVEFDDYSEVYHLIIDNEVLTSFVIDNQKIISFSYNISKHINKARTPLILSDI